MALTIRVGLITLLLAVNVAIATVRTEDEACEKCIDDGCSYMEGNWDCPEGPFCVYTPVYYDCCKPDSDGRISCTDDWNLPCVHSPFRCGELE